MRTLFGQKFNILFVGDTCSSSPTSSFTTLRVLFFTFFEGTFGGEEEQTVPSTRVVFKEVVESREDEAVLRRVIDGDTVERAGAIGRRQSDGVGTTKLEDKEEEVRAGRRIKDVPFRLAERITF